MGVPIKPKGHELAFTYGDENITFERVRRQHTTDKVLIKVHPDCRVIVSAPESSANAAVIAAVKKRGRWIYQQLRDFRAQSEHITPRQYISGESHYYLGKQYLLKVIVAPNQIQCVKLLRGKLEVTVRLRNTEKVKTLLADWYRARARETFIKRLDAMLEQTLWVVERPPIRILSMQTQWGSCSPNGCITLNPHLVKAPRECIDYVILHELCHIAEHNHSDQFYRLMSRVMPTWAKTKDQLDGMASIILS